MDNRNFLVRRWYGPVAEALASSYPNIYFNFPDTRSDVEQYASAIADQYIGHRRFDQPVTGATLLPAEGCYVAVCGGVGNGDYGLPNHRSNLHRS